MHQVLLNRVINIEIGVFIIKVRVYRLFRKVLSHRIRHEVLIVCRSVEGNVVLLDGLAINRVGNRVWCNIRSLWSIIVRILLIRLIWFLDIGLLVHGWEVYSRKLLWHSHKVVLFW